MANSDDDVAPPLNQQIVDAVQTSTDYAFGVPGGAGGAPKYNAGEAIAYEKVAQACAYQVQDATDYQRNILSVNGAAQSKALALMFKDAAETPPNMQKLEFHAIIFVLSIVGSFAAGLTTEFLGTNAGKVLENFPPK